MDEAGKGPFSVGNLKDDLTEQLFLANTQMYVKIPNNNQAKSREKDNGYDQCKSTFSILKTFKT